jgi:hypothetical protein
MSVATCKGDSRHVTLTCFRENHLLAITLFVFSLPSKRLPDNLSQYRLLTATQLSCDMWSPCCN